MSPKNMIEFSVDNLPAINMNLQNLPKKEYIEFGTRLYLCYSDIISVPI